MCTAVSWGENYRYFGRNLDLWCRYDTKVIINRNGKYPVMGMGIEANGYPLYFDAINEKGLAIAGLNFPGNAIPPGKSVCALGKLLCILPGRERRNSAFPYKVPKRRGC